MKLIKAAMIGDVVGSHGLETLEAVLPVLIREQNIDFVTVNGENVNEGFGITAADFHRIMAAGADAVTSGNHVWEKREFWQVLESEKTILRPANYPSRIKNNREGGAAETGAPGTGFVLIKKNDITWMVVNLQGREYMNAIDCPFQCFDKVINEQANTAKPVIVIVDFHAESSREKEAFAYYADGRASLIAGTHTHVQTADERILPNGSAYITDLGMTGNTNSVIGMDPKICQERFFKQVQYQLKTASAEKPGQPGQMNGIIAEIDADTGTAVSVKRI